MNGRETPTLEQLWRIEVFGALNARQGDRVISRYH